ncbi:MAG: hypothetical protein M3680_09420 [Myxococcota bacterium]|nr:hypothetical protein [Myxococcota bacterium]
MSSTASLSARATACARWFVAWPPLAYAFVAWIAFVLGAYPGYLSFDSTLQLMHVRAGSLSDAHAPVMSALWSACEYVMAGPFPMLLLQSGLLLFGLAAVLRTVVSRRAAAVTAGAILLFPPVFAPMAVIWPDSLMAGALVAATGAALEPGRRWRAIAAGLLVLACSCRPAIAIAIVPLVLLVLPASGRWRRAALAIALTFGIAGSARLADHLLVDERAYGWHEGLLGMDLVGTLRRARVAEPAALDGALAGVATLQRAAGHDRIVEGGRDALDGWPLFHGPAPVFTPITSDDAAAALAVAWGRAIVAHPDAYLRHRWLMTRQLLGLSGRWAPVYDDFASPDLLASISHRATASDWQTGMRAIVRATARTPLFRPWLYVLLALALWFLTRPWPVVRALVVSGLSYELALFVLAPRPEYRYSHWLVTTTCLALVAFVVDRRGAWRKP